MTVESVIKDILQGARPRKGSSSIQLKEAIAPSVSSQMQSPPSANDMSINQKGSQMKRPADAAASDNSSTSPTQNTGTSSIGTKAVDNTTTNPNPNANQNVGGRPSVADMIKQYEDEKAAPQREYEKKMAEWEAKYGKTYREQQAQRDQQNREQEENKVGTQAWREKTLAAQSEKVQADRVAAKAASSYVSPEQTYNFDAVEASRQRAAEARAKNVMSPYEVPTMLPPEELAAKRRAQGENITPEDIIRQREELKQKRIEFDRTRPEGQPKSFTDTGESPEFGKRADGTRVGPFTKPKEKSGQEGERSIEAKALGVDQPAKIGFGGDDLAASTSISGVGIAASGINTGSEKVERKQFSFGRRMEGFVSFLGRDIRKKMISEALINLISK